MIEFARRKNGEGNGNLAIRNWTPRHTAIVMDRIAGSTVTELADKYNIAEGYISVICNARRAKAIIAAVEQRILQEKFDNLGEMRKAGIIKAQQRILDFISNDDLHNIAPLACAPLDMKAFETLNNAEKALAPAANVSNTYNTQVNVLGSEVKRDALAEGLRRASLVEEMHAHVTGESVDHNKEAVKLIK